jgi:RNA polymerase sigma factor (sigma-70 family)
MQKSMDRRRWVLATLEQYESRLLRFAVRLVGDENTARDAVQHAFLRLCDQSAETLDGRVGPWLFAVCRNYTVDVLRRRGNETPSTLDAAELPADAADPAEAAEQAEASESLRRLLDQLPTAQREAVLLWSEGFRYRQIAAMTATTEGAVRVAVHRALERLRNCAKAMELKENNI